MPRSSQSSQNKSNSSGKTGQPAFANSAAPWLSLDAIALLEKHLAQAIGPLARVLVKTEMRKTSNRQELVKALAAHIEKPDARAAFLAQAKP